VPHSLVLGHEVRRALKIRDTLVLNLKVLAIPSFNVLDIDAKKGET